MGTSTVDFSFFRVFPSRRRWARQCGFLVPALLVPSCNKSNTNCRLFSEIWHSCGKIWRRWTARECLRRWLQAWGASFGKGNHLRRWRLLAMWCGCWLHPVRRHESRASCVCKRVRTCRSGRVTMWSRSAEMCDVIARITVGSASATEGGRGPWDNR